MVITYVNSNEEYFFSPVEKIVEEEGDMYPMKSNRFREAKPVIKYAIFFCKTAK